MYSRGYHPLITNSPAGASISIKRAYICFLRSKNKGIAGNRFEKWHAPLSTALRQAGFSQKFAEINNTVISYVRGPNNGTPLVLLPAQMGTWRTYEKVAPALSTNFEVFAVDMPGHGSSSWLTGAYNWDSVGRYLGDFLEQVVTRPAVIAGNSSSGIFALWLAAHRPESVAAIILEDAPVFFRRVATVPRPRPVCVPRIGSRG